MLLHLGHEARLCAPPDFRDWVESFGIAFVPLGPDLRWTATAKQEGNQWKISNLQQVI